MIHHSNVIILKVKPVSTLSPICNSDIAIDLPFSTFTVATDGKQLPPPPDGGDGGGGGGTVNNHYSLLLCQNKK